MREGYRRLLAASLAHRRVVYGGFCILGVACASLAPFIGSDFFPPVDAGQIRLHVRAPAGTRIEEKETYFSTLWRKASSEHFKGLMFGRRSTGLQNGD